MSVTTDGHKTNVRFHNEQGSSSNPLYSVNHYSVDPDSRIYLLYDTVHLFKNFYNNLMNRKTFHAPPFPGTNHDVLANFQHLVELYNF